MQVNPEDPPPQYQPPPPAQGSLQVQQHVTNVTMMSQPTTIRTGGCGFCGGVLKEEYTICGILLCLLCFPWGLICCLSMTEWRCSSCGR